MDETTVDGTYIPVLFENLTDPIITGRDELGMPKLYCEIDIEHSSKSLNMQASWRGASFVSIHIADLDVADNGSSATGGERAGVQVHTRGWREGKGGLRVCRCHTSLRRGEKGSLDHQECDDIEEGNISFHTLDRERLPTLYHVAETLSEIPVYEGAKVVEGLGVRDLSSARRIE